MATHSPAWRREQKALGHCTSCARPREDLERSECRRCLKAHCEAKARQRNTRLRTDGRGTGPNHTFTRRHSGQKGAAAFRAEYGDTVILAKPPKAPSSSWWAVSSREEFMRRERDEQARMNRALLPRAVERALNQAGEPL